MDKKYIQLQRFITHQEKKNAIILVQQEINNNFDSYLDGEEIVIEYKGPDGAQMYSTAVIRKENGIASVYASVEENETVRIIESDDEPRDKSVLWLSEDEDDPEETAEGLKRQIRELQQELKKMQEMLDKHDYALSSTIAGGDIITNSEKYRLESSHETEKPEDADYEPSYAEDDKTVVDFDMYIGNTPFYDYYQHTTLYEGQAYQIKPRFFNSIGEVINPEEVSGLTDIEVIVLRPDIATFDYDGFILKATSTGNTPMVAEITLDDGRTIRKDYMLKFEHNEEPYYERYGEPNVHHMLIKESSTFDILTANTDYLCANELVWCVDNETLYIRAHNKKGGISLFKVNGTGSTGETTDVVTFVVENNILYANGEPLSVDNGIFSIPVATVENGVLNLIDKNS